MDIRLEILKRHSKAQTAKIVKYIGNNPKRFASLVHIFLDGPYRVTQRAAWALSCCAEEDPKLIYPHLNKIIDFARRPGVHDAVKRNVVRLLQFIEIPKRLHGKVADMCFKFLSDKSEAIAIRCFSMSVLGRIARENEGLKNELRLAIEDVYPYATAGLLVRARKVMAQIREPVRM